MVSLKMSILQSWVTWASKITLKNLQLCSIKIKGSHAPCDVTWAALLDFDTNKTTRLATFRCAEGYTYFKPTRATSLASHTLRRERKGLVSLAKPDPSTAWGSGRKPILRFVPAAQILQSNQIAERAFTTYWHPVKTVDFVFSRGFVLRSKHSKSVWEAVRTWKR